MGESPPVRHVEIAHQRDGIVVAQRVEIAGQGGGIGVQHEQGRFAAVHDAVRPRRGQPDVVQTEQHRQMMMDGVGRGPVAAHGDAGQPQPLPQLVEIPGVMRLSVDDGNGEASAAPVEHVIDARVLRQVVIQRGPKHPRFGVRLGTAHQRGHVETDAPQRLHDSLSPDTLVARAYGETEHHTDDPSHGEREHHARHRIPGQHHQQDGHHIQRVPAPFHGGAHAARAGHGQEGGEPRIEIRDEPRTAECAGGFQTLDQGFKADGRDHGRQGPHGRVPAEHGDQRDRGLQPFPVGQQLEEHADHNGDGDDLLQQRGRHIHHPADRLSGVVHVGFHARREPPQIHRGQQHERGDDQCPGGVHQIGEIPGAPRGGCRR